MTTDCYCRGVATCPNCEQHICSGQCTCDVDGAPQETAAGWVNPSPARIEAWNQKLEVTR